MSIQSISSQNNAALSSINPTLYSYSAAPAAQNAGAAAATNSLNFDLSSSAVGSGGKSFDLGQVMMGLIQMVTTLINQLVGLFGGAKPQPGSGGENHIMSPEGAASGTAGNDASTTAATNSEGSESKKSTWSKVLEAGLDIASSYFGKDSSGSSTGSSKSGFDWGSAFKTVAGWFGY